jgi:hypothetical protein
MDGVPSKRTHFHHGGWKNNKFNYYQVRNPQAKSTSVVSLLRDDDLLVLITKVDRGEIYPKLNMEIPTTTSRRNGTNQSREN